MFSHHVSASSPVIAADSRCQVVAVEIFKCMKIFNNDGAPPSSQPPGQTRCWHNHQHRHSTHVSIHSIQPHSDMLWWPGGLYSEWVSVFVQLFATWQTIFPCLGPYSTIDNSSCLQLYRGTYSQSGAFQISTDSLQFLTSEHIDMTGTAGPTECRMQEQINVWNEFNRLMSMTSWSDSKRRYIASYGVISSIKILWQQENVCCTIRDGSVCTFVAACPASGLWQLLHLALVSVQRREAVKCEREHWDLWSAANSEFIASRSVWFYCYEILLDISHITRYLSA